MHQHLGHIRLLNFEINMRLGKKKNSTSYVFFALPRPLVPIMPEITQQKNPPKVGAVCKKSLAATYSHTG